MKQYKILRDSNLKDFETELNELIKIGWIVRGSIVFSNDNDFHILLYK
ncbi:hypothetical protein [Faecalibacter rhinopitheci]|uniref:DUF1737 domain-containing protein n=1 Tax=Faecalibacter rhinopitheci TaxID=2779678 RepID=A0A8J7FV84_9FLAO|nr:hypothetical protein [Faecalibacter rhinopitheci]MBF0596906.1 hypothetical protein [Faecalibacter rhinopitheci]